MKKKLKKKKKSKKQIKIEQANMQTDAIAMSSDGLQYTGSFSYDSMDPGDLKDIDIARHFGLKNTLTLNLNYL